MSSNKETGLTGNKIIIGQIYLLRSDNLFKIGYTQQHGFQRYRNYEKEGWEPICIQKCCEPIILEDKLKKRFSDKYTLVKGSEFFKGNMVKDNINIIEEQMYDDFMELVTAHHNEYKELARDSNNILTDEGIAMEGYESYDDAYDYNDSDDPDYNPHNNSNNDKSYESNGSSDDADDVIEVSDEEEIIVVSDEEVIVVSDEEEVIEVSDGKVIEHIMNREKKKEFIKYTVKSNEEYIMLLEKYRKTKDTVEKSNIRTKLDNLINTLVDSIIL